MSEISKLFTLKQNVSVGVGASGPVQNLMKANDSLSQEKNNHNYTYTHIFHI